MILLFLESTFAWWVGVALSRAMGIERRSERAVASMLIGFSIIQAAIMVLGWSSLLTATNLALLVPAIGAVLAAFACRRDTWLRVRESTGDFVRILAMPFVAIRDSWRVKSGIALCLSAVLLLLAWSVFLSWLAPSSSWDGLWYHEPLAEFAIQNRGFDLVELPLDLLWINGYPRTGENLMLWMIIFGDRTWIDVVPQLVSPLAVVATYVLARRLTQGWRIGAAGIAVAMWTVPAVILQMRSSYVDVVVLAFFMTSLVYVTAKTFKVSDVWMAALSLGLLGGIKSSMPLYVAAIGAFALPQIVSLARRVGWARTAAHVIPAIMLMLALFAPTYIRNFLDHGNPLWPLKVHFAGLDFDGPSDLGNMQHSLEYNVRELWGIPRTGEVYHDTRFHAFGFGLSYLGIPVLVLAILRMVQLAVVGPRRGIWAPAAVTLLGLLTLVLSPSFHWGRYALPAVACGLVACMWFFANVRARPMAESFITAIVVLNLITFVWDEPGWRMPLHRVSSMLGMSSEMRARLQVSPNMPTTELAELRERIVREGDSVAIDGRATFISYAWNEEISNRVVYVHHSPGDDTPYLDRIDKLDPRMVLVDSRSPEGARMSRAPGWTMISRGPFHHEWYIRSDGGDAQELPE